MPAVATNVELEGRDRHDGPTAARVDETVEPEVGIEPKTYRLQGGGVPPH
jgi:hypothetical protein